LKATIPAGSAWSGTPVRWLPLSGPPLQWRFAAPRHARVIQRTHAFPTMMRGRVVLRLRRRSSAAAQNKPGFAPSPPPAALTRSGWFPFPPERHHHLKFRGRVTRVPLTTAQPTATWRSMLLWSAPARALLAIAFTAFAIAGNPAEAAAFASSAHPTAQSLIPKKFLASYQSYRQHGVIVNSVYSEDFFGSRVLRLKPSDCALRVCRHAGSSADAFRGDGGVRGCRRRHQAPRAGKSCPRNRFTLQHVAIVII
jgi:hypothetical protein